MADNIATIASARLYQREIGRTRKYLIIANAKSNFQIEPNNLYVSEIKVDEGPKLKRWRARARGRAMEIQKKTSHITLALDEIKPTKKKKTSTLDKFFT